ncbi:MAG: sortase [bacterium]|nr:sortase [bacterium]
MHYLKTKKRKSKRYLLIVGLLLFLCGSIYFIYNYKQNNDNKKIEDESINEFFKEEPVSNIEEKNNQNQSEVKINKTIDYMAILEIPIINLKKGLVDINSSSNNVNNNIYILKESTFPKENEDSHIILAAHSGNSSISYFKNIIKLNINDRINLYYQNNLYKYDVIKKYEIEKTGKLNIDLTNNSDLTLVSCISNTNKQIVILAELKQVYKY